MDRLHRFFPHFFDTDGQVQKPQLKIICSQLARHCLLFSICDDLKLVFYSSIWLLFAICRFGTHKMNYNINYPVN
jgi:hypothetical protein